MNSIEHSKLCKDLDFILINGGSPQIVANQYLHIADTHSDNLKKYIGQMLIREIRFQCVSKMTQSNQSMDTLVMPNFAH